MRSIEETLCAVALPCAPRRVKTPTAHVMVSSIAQRERSRPRLSLPRHALIGETTFWGGGLRPTQTRSRAVDALQRSRALAQRADCGAGRVGRTLGANAVMPARHVTELSSAVHADHAIPALVHRWRIRSSRQRRREGVTDLARSRLGLLETLGFWCVGPGVDLTPRLLATEEMPVLVHPRLLGRCKLPHVFWCPVTAEIVLENKNL